MLLVLGDLEHLGDAAPGRLAEERYGSRTAAEPAFYLPASFEYVALVGSQRIGSWWFRYGRRLVLFGGLIGSGQLVEGTIQKLE